MSDTLRAACQLASMNWTLSGDQVFRLYQQVEKIRKDMPNAVCGDCQGSGYGGHPDSGANCSTCHGSGGVYVDPVWQALGAISEADAIERITVLQGIATGQLGLTPPEHFYAVTSVSGSHIGMWSDRATALEVVRDYPGSSLTELLKVSHG